MQEPMFCVCGFSAHSGNKLAKHIGTHGCKSAYPNLEEAIKARVAGGGDGQAATNDDKVGSTLDQELEKGLDPRISITEAHKSSEKAAQKEGSIGAPAGEATEETAGPLAFLGLQRKGSREEEKKDEDMDIDKEGKTIEEKEGKTIEKREGKTDEDTEGKTDEVFEKEQRSDKPSDSDKEDNESKEDETMRDNEEKEEGGMDVDEENEDKGEDEDGDEQKQPKEAGSVLFGTLFKYMGEKKDEESKDDTTGEAASKEEKSCTQDESTSSGDNIVSVQKDEEASDLKVDDSTISKGEDNLTAASESNDPAQRKHDGEGGLENKTGTEEKLGADGENEEKCAEKEGETSSESQAKDAGKEECSEEEVKTADACDADEKMES